MCRWDLFEWLYSFFYHFQWVTSKFQLPTYWNGLNPWQRNCSVTLIRFACSKGKKTCQFWRSRVMTKFDSQSIFQLLWVIIKFQHDINVKRGNIKKKTMLYELWSSWLSLLFCIQQSLLPTLCVSLLPFRLTLLLLLLLPLSLALHRSPLTEN